MKTIRLLMEVTMPTGNEHLFDEAIDDATHMVIEAFTWANLPEGDELSNLMVRINDALTNIMKEYNA